MTSPLASRLVSSIRSSTDHEQRAIYVAELACYWARVGKFEEAEQLRSELRQDFGDGRSTPVSILIMCLESLLLYFKELSPQARDRMLRANLLCIAFHQHRLTALTSAWMAHIDFNQNRFLAMSDGLLTCAKSIHADDGSAECRASLVLGDAFLFAGDASASKLWYENARRTATNLGDHAAIGAMTYNRAALRVSTARFRNLRNPVATDEISLLNGEVNSAINYQAAAQLASLDHLLGAARAGVLMLQRDYEHAKVHIEQLLSLPDIANSSTQQRLLQSDLFYICAMSGASPEAEAWLENVMDLAQDMTPDDRALIMSTASSVAAMLNKTILRDEFELDAGKAIEAHGATIKTLRDHIDIFKHGTFPTPEFSSRS